jgi:hypothetical protein
MDRPLVPAPTDDPERVELLHELARQATARRKSISLAERRNYRRGRRHGANRHGRP